MKQPRLSTGIPGLDELMGGGLLPGTLTVLAGATGIGKTQFGVQFSQAGLEQEGRRGIIFDMACRGDAQSHGEYAQRMFQWQLDKADPSRAPATDGFFHPERKQPDYLHVFDYHGRRVTRRDLGSEAWQDWQVELAKKLDVTIAFFYGNFVSGVRRAVVDGIEPAERASESIQFELFEYVYHQILRKESEWVARDLFRQHYRAHAEQIQQAAYDPSQVACLLLYTTPETMLEELIVRKLDEGDLLSNANTLVYLGRVRSGNKLGRALYVAKHRGSACTEEIVPYTIDDRGLRIG
ncbi:MAG TPA: ATPase domain-containing protein [Pirellulales bacterium]|nr:ATPase domain-containing protein [Pirellulales bacterium]